MLALRHSDRAVVRKVLGGNLAAFRVLVDRYGGAVHGVAYARLRNASDAEDVAQETFLRFFQQLDQMAHRRHVGSWLLSVARNVSVDVLRRRMREAERLRPAAPARAVAPDPVREEIRQLLWSQIEKLDPEAQELLVLHYFLKKKAREIAVLLDVTTNTAEKRLQRAREELGRQLTEALGNEVGELRPDARRSARIMAAVCAAPVAWKVSAGAATAAATAAGVATGASAAKLAGALACAVVLALLGYFLYDKYAYPFSTQDITEKSTVTVADSVQRKAPRVDQSQEAGVAKETATGAEQETAAASVVTKVYGVVTGTVWNEDGAPAAGAEVWVDNEEQVSENQKLAQDYLHVEVVAPFRLAATTDSLGRYRINDVPLCNESVSYMVSASKGGFFARSMVSATHLEREMERDLVLQPDWSVGGVVKGDGGKPVEGARVGVEQIISLGSRTFAMPSKTTGADGRFLINHVPPGSCRLRVNSDQYISHVSPWLATGVTDHVLQLDSGNWISGRVVNIETGEGVGDVLISGTEVTGEADRQYYWNIFGKADSTGAFRVTGCKPGNYQMSVGPTRPLTTPMTLVEPLSVTVGTQPVTGVELKMATGGVLRGRVIDDETGQPAPEGSGVWAGKEDGRHGRGCQTGAGGAYELLGLHEGELTVRASDSTGRINRYEGKVTLQPGEVKENYDIHLPVRAFGGTVVDELGKPVAGASVYAVATGSGFELATTISDGQGRFRFGIDHGKIPASVSLQAMTADGYSAKTGPIRTSAVSNDIVLRIKRSGRLEGDVADQDGRPLKRLVISAMPQSAEAVIPLRNLPINEGRSINKPLGDKNVFVYARLHPGQCTIEVRCSWSDRPLATTDVMVEAGRTTTAHLVVDMSEFGEIEGVVLADGKPVAGQVIHAEHESGRGAVAETAGPDGSYNIRMVLPGRVRVTAMPQYGISGRQVEQTAEVVSGEVTTLNFDLSGGGEATGSIEGYVMSGGAPVQGCKVIVKGADASADSASYTAPVDYHGWYKIEQIPEGNYVAEAALGRAVQTVPMQVAAGQTTRADIELPMGVVRGTVSGIREGEKAYVMLFPGDAYLSEWTLAAMEVLGDRMLNMKMIGEDGPFSFNYLNPGEYIVGVVALPADEPFEPASIMKGRIAVSDIVAAGVDAPAEVELVIE